MVVQECHLWLNLVEVKDVDKARFLDAPISQAGLFGNTVEGFAQQFSAVQQQTEAIQHTCPGVMHDAPSTAAPGARPQSAHRRGRPLASCVLQSCSAPGRIDTLAGASNLSQESGAPRVPARPQVVQEVDEAAPTRANRRCWNLLFIRRRRENLPLVEGREENLPFLFRRWPKGQLRDSVHQATSQVQRRSRDVSGNPERPCLARGDCCPPGERRNRAGPSSREEAGVLQPLLHRTQEMWWPSSNPRSSSFEPGFTQAPVQDADAQAHYQMHPAPGLVCSDRPEGCLLSCFDPFATQTVPTVCVRRSGMAVQGPPLRALPVWVGITQQCHRSLSPWTDLAFLRAAAPLEQVYRHNVVPTDASSTGWGATCNGQAASGLWTGPRLLWHINCLELWAVHLALCQFRPLLLGKHVLVHTDNTAAVSYINRLGGIRSHRLSQLARHLLLWRILWRILL